MKLTLAKYFVSWINAYKKSMWDFSQIGIIYSYYLEKFPQNWRHDLCDKLGYWFNIYFHLFGPQNSHRKWFARKLIISLQFELHDIQKWILRCSIAEQATSKIDLRLPETLIGKLIARRMIYQKNWCFKNRLRFFYLFVRICHPSR